MGMDSNEPKPTADRVRAVRAARDDTEAAERKAIFDRGDLCACGCGEYTTRTAPMLRVQDRDTAEALGWAESSIATMRVPVPLLEGHEADGERYVLNEGACNGP